MVDIKTKVQGALTSIAEANVFFYFPQTFKKMPCISYYEANNTPATVGDDMEYLSEITYIVDVWGGTSALVSALAIQVDAAMKTLGFWRAFAADVHDSESNVRHKTMRFTVKT